MITAIIFLIAFAIFFVFVITSGLKENESSNNNTTLTAEENLNKNNDKYYIKKYKEKKEYYNQEDIEALKKTISIQNEKINKLNQKIIDLKKENPYSNNNTTLTTRINFLEIENSGLKKDIYNLKNQNSILKNSPSQYKEKIEYENAKKTIITLENAICTLQEKNHKLEEKNQKYYNIINFAKKPEEENIPQEPQTKDFRKKYTANYRCKDGHYVRSKSEREIDDFLFEHNIKHIYEKEYFNPIKHKKFCPDFTLPDQNIIIEYFGLTNNEYNENKEEKIAIYTEDNRYNFEYLTNEDDFDIVTKMENICNKYSIQY